MKSISKIFIFVLFFLLSTSSVSAAPLIKNKVISPSPVVAKPLLPQMSASQALTIKDPVNRDLFAAGSQVSLEATVSGDVYVAGGQVDIKNNVSNNLIIAGGVVNISGTVNKNLIMAGGQVTLEPTAIINGYILGAADQATISGKVNGPVKLFARILDLTDKSSIDGDLEVHAQEVNINPNAKITGEKRITYVAISKKNDQNKVKTFLNNSFSAATFFSFIGQLLVLFVLIKIFGKKLTSLVSPVFNKPFSFLGQGFMCLIITPLVVILMLTTIIGIPLGVITAFDYGLSLYFSCLVGAVIIGQWLYSKKWIVNNNLYLQGFVSYLLLFVVGLIPVLGPIFKFLLFLISLGLIFYWQKSWFKNPSETN